MSYLYLSWNANLGKLLAVHWRVRHLHYCLPNALVVIYRVWEAVMSFNSVNGLLRLFKRLHTCLYDIVICGLIVLYSNIIPSFTSTNPLLSHNNTGTLVNRMRLCQQDLWAKWKLAAMKWLNLISTWYHYMCCLLNPNLQSKCHVIKLFILGKDDV